MCSERGVGSRGRKKGRERESERGERKEQGRRRWKGKEKEQEPAEQGEGRRKSVEWCYGRRRLVKLRGRGVGSGEAGAWDCSGGFLAAMVIGGSGL